MSELYDPIDSLISELKGNARFLKKLMFPKVSLFIGSIGIVIAVILLVLR